MNLFNAKRVSAVVVAEEFSKAEFPLSDRRDSDVQLLGEAELEKVGGGDPMVCW